MDSRNQPLPQALVLRWDDHALRVKCPYCLYSHSHAFSRTPSEHDVDRTQQGWQLLLPSYLRIRRSDCNFEDGESHYVFVFPTSGEAAGVGYGWELDRGEQAFVAVDSRGVVPVPVNDCRDGRTLLARYEAKAKAKVRTKARAKAEAKTTAQQQLALSIDDLAAETEDLELAQDREKEKEKAEEQSTQLPIPNAERILQELYEDRHFRRDMYASHCSSCDLPNLVSLCRQYPNDGLIGSIDREGNTGSLLAATEENGLSVLKWLHKRGDFWKRANHYGRTPLMEAALWGRLDNVRYLIREGCDIDTRDANGMRAIDLSDDTERNTKERTIRSGQFYREASVAGQLRKQIHAFLERAASSSSSSSSAGTAVTRPPQRRAFFDRKPNGSPEILRPRESVEPPVGKLEKAFATLDRGPNYPYVNAMSGYTQPDWPNVLANEEWATKANALRAFFGLSDSKALASHVEPQLLAYLLDRHSLIKWDSHLDHYLSRLESVRPDHSIRPVVTISKRYICSSCETFIQHFQRKFPGFRVDFHCVGDTAAPPLVVLSI